MNFAEGEVIDGNILVSARESLFGDGELVHKGETEVVLFGGEVHFEKAAREFFGGFPADLATETGFVPGGTDTTEIVEEEIQDGFEEVPIFGAGGEEGAEVEVGALRLVNVEDGEIALAGGGDVETET